MTFERVVVQGPLRSTSQVCDELIGFLERCLTEFGHPGAALVRSVLDPAQPLLRTLTTRRGFPGPAVSLHVAGTEVLVRIAYDPEVTEHLAIPIVKPLSGEDAGTGALVIVHTASEVEPGLRDAAESAGHDALRLEVRLAPAPADVPVPQDMPVPDDMPAPDPVPSATQDEAAVEAVPQETAVAPAPAPAPAPEEPEPAVRWPEGSAAADPPLYGGEADSPAPVGHDG